MKNDKNYNLKRGRNGFTPEDVMQDEEGLQTMRTLGYNMAWMLISIENGNQPLPEREPWSPLGTGRMLNNELLQKNSMKYHKSVVQVYIRMKLIFNRGEEK